MEAITTFPEFREKLMLAISYSLQFGRIPQALYPRMAEDRNIHLYCPYFRIQEVLDMATKNPKKNRSNFGDVEFVNFKFDKDTKAQFQAWFETKGNTVIEAIFNTLQADNKMSVSYDNQNDCFIGSMTGKDGSLNPKKCLTIRSSEWFKAMAACAYVHTIIFDGEIWNVEDSTDMV